MSTQTHSFGATLTYNGYLVGSITFIGGVEVTASFQDVTTHNSTGGYKAWIPGTKEVSNLEVQGFFDQTDTNGQIAMKTDFFDTHPIPSRTATIAFPASTGWSQSVTCYIEKLKIGEFPIDGAIPFIASLKVTGAPSAGTASNNLTNLVLTTATLHPTFAAATYDYVATTSGATFTVTPTFSAGTCTITANGASQTIASGVASSAISAGSIGTVTPVTIVVQETGKSLKSYTVRVAKTA